MYILTIRTDKQEAEVGIYNDLKQLDYDAWLAHRSLAATINARIETLLDIQNLQYSDIGGIVCFEGPGSFTGLRIGLTVGNILAYSAGIKIVACSDVDKTSWQEKGIERLIKGDIDQIALPKYGSAAIVTVPKK